MTQKPLGLRSTRLRSVIAVLSWDVPTLTLTRRLLLANGLGILAVVIHHATAWGMTAMFWWADSYRVTNALPDLASLGSFAYYVLLVTSVLTRFSVPTFLFVSGFSMAYGLRGTGPAGRTRKIIGSRLVWLLVPYLIWSLVVFAARWLESCEEGCQAEAVGSYMQKLLLGKADAAYWYVFVLTALMVFAPFLAQMAQARRRELLATTLILLLGIRLLPYLNPVIHIAVLTEPLQLFLLTFSQIFYFALGLVYRFHLDEMKQRVHRLQVLLPWLMIVFAALATIDTEIFSRFDFDGDGLSPDHAHASIFAEGFALTIILSFMAFERIPVPGTRSLITLGSFVYGIYLLHPLLLEYLARAVHRLTPWFLAYPIAFLLYLLAGGVGLPLLFMIAVKHSPFRRYYRYLFG